MWLQTVKEREIISRGKRSTVDLSLSVEQREIKSQWRGKEKKVQNILNHKMFGIVKIQKETQV